MNGRARYRREEALTGAVFLLPGLGIITVCVFVPIVLAFGLSFTHCSRFLTIRWAGLYNYQKLLSDPLALRSLGNTVFYVAVFVPMNLLLSLGIALLLNQRFKGMRLIRSAYFVPVVLSMVVTVSIFRFLYDYNFGPINAFLGAIGFRPVPWLDHRDWAMWAIIAMAIWKSAAFFSIIVLAALQDVPRQLHEAAMMDGAGLLSRFRNVTIPSIMPVLAAITALSSIGAFRVFVPMFVLTNGGPAFATRTMALHAYATGFDEGNLGQSSAISFALLAMIVAATLVLNWARRRTQ